MHFIFWIWLRQQLSLLEQIIFPELFWPTVSRAAQLLLNVLCLKLSALCCLRNKASLSFRIGLKGSVSPPQKPFLPGNDHIIETSFWILRARNLFHSFHYSLLFVSRVERITSSRRVRYRL